MGRDSCSKGRWFESRCRILDGHNIFSHIIVKELYCLFEKTKINEKEAEDGPFKKIILFECLWLRPLNSDEEGTIFTSSKTGNRSLASSNVSCKCSSFFFFSSSVSGSVWSCDVNFLWIGRAVPESSLQISNHLNMEYFTQTGAIWAVGREHSLSEGNLQFEWLGFSCFAYVELDRDLQIWSNPNQSNRRSVVQWYFPLQCKRVFSGSRYLGTCVRQFKSWSCIARFLRKCSMFWIIRPIIPIGQLPRWSIIRRIKQRGRPTMLKSIKAVKFYLLVWYIWLLPWCRHLNESTWVNIINNIKSQVRMLSKCQRNYLIDSLAILLKTIYFLLTTATCGQRFIDNQHMHFGVCQAINRLEFFVNATKSYQDFNSLTVPFLAYTKLNLHGGVNKVKSAKTEAWFSGTTTSFRPTCFRLTYFRPINKGDIF